MHPRRTEEGASQSTKMESVMGDTEGQKIKFQERNTETQQGLKAVKGSSSYFGSDQIYQFRKSLKLDQVIQSLPLLPSMKWKFCIFIAMKFAFSFVCLGG